MDDLMKMPCLYMNDESHKKIGAEEPTFVLRAQDLCAPEVVEAWIAVARKAGTPEAKLEHAQLHADAMRLWAGAKKVPD